MTELLVLSLLYVATAVFYASAPVKRRPRLVWFSTLPRRVAARGVAVMAIASAFGLWAAIEPGPAAGFMITIGLMVLATLIAVVGPLVPKAVWAVAMLASVAIPVLALCRGLQ
jgi:hypothetical protein